VTKPVRDFYYCTYVIICTGDGHPGYPWCALPCKGLFPWTTQQIGNRGGSFRAVEYIALNNPATALDLTPTDSHLEAARVGEHAALPVDEAVQAPQLRNHLRRGPVLQVVGVSQDDVAVNVRQLLTCQRLHRTCTLKLSRYLTRRQWNAGKCTLPGVRANEHEDSKLVAVCILLYTVKIHAGSCVRKALLEMGSLPRGEGGGSLPWVPTGMNMGVSAAKWGRVMIEVLARPCCATTCAQCWLHYHTIWCQ